MTANSMPAVLGTTGSNERWCPSGICDNARQLAAVCSASRTLGAANAIPALTSLLLPGEAAEGGPRRNGPEVDVYLGAMNLRLVKFSLCSLGLHAAVFLWLWHPGSFESGIAGEAQGRSNALIVATLQGTRLPDRPPVADRSEKSTALLTSRRTRTAQFAAAESKSLSMAGIEMSSPPEIYLSVGRLTRLPAPIFDIDLDVAEISEIGFAGTAELSLMIDADGSVAGVVLPELAEADRTFSERAAERLRHVRFRPGEVDGKAVKSQVRIVVVSERLPSGDNTQ